MKNIQQIVTPAEYSKPLLSLHKGIKLVKCMEIVCPSASLQTYLPLKSAKFGQS